MEPVFSGNADLQYKFFYQLRLAVADLRLVDIGRKKNDKLTGFETDIAQVVLRDGIKGEVFFLIIGGGRLLPIQGGIAEFFGPRDHDLDIGIVAMAFGVAFLHGLRGIFIDDGEGVVPVDVVFAYGQGVETGGQREVDGFCKMRVDGLVPE